MKKVRGRERERGWARVTERGPGKPGPLSTDNNTNRVKVLEEAWLGDVSSISSSYLSSDGPAYHQSPISRIPFRQKAPPTVFFQGC